jgi:hypothetical protein
MSANFGSGGMGKNARHYHIVSADMIGSSRFLKDNRDDLYKKVLDDFYLMVRNAQIALSKRYRFIEKDKLAGIYPIGGDSFWMFVPASREKEIVENSFSFTINLIKDIKKDFESKFAVHDLDIRIGVHTTVKEKMPDGSTKWVALDEGFGELKEDSVYKMPLFNRIFSRDFVVARRLEQAAREKEFETNMLFSSEFILRMTEYGGVTNSQEFNDKVHLNLKSGTKLVFTRHPASEIKTRRIREKLIECRIGEVYEMK